MKKELLFLLLISQLAQASGEVRFHTGAIIDGGTSGLTINSGKGPLSVGGTATSSAIFDTQSTTKGARPCPLMTQTQRDAISSPATGLCVFNTTSNQNNVYNGTAWVAMGGAGAGGVNFISQDTSWNVGSTDDRDLNTSVGNWVAFADAAASIPVDLTGGSPTVTCTRTITNPLDGAGSLLITKDAANRQGEGCAVPFNVQPAYQGQPATITLPLNIVSGSLMQGDVYGWVYNVTKSVLIRPDSCDIIAGPAVVCTFPLTAVDATPVNHQYRFGPYFASTSTTAVTLKADDISVSPGQAAYGAAGSNALTFTPTLNGIVASSQTCTKQRDKDYLIVDCKITTGTNAASTASITLPDNLSIDYTKIRSGETKEVGIFHRRTNGGPSSVVDTNASPISAFTDGTDTTHVFFGKTTTNYELDKINASTLLNNSEKVDFRFTVPIAGYDVGFQASPSTTYRISSYLANGTRVTTAPTALGQYRSRYRASSSSGALTDVAPTVAPSATDGMRIYGNAPFNAAGTSGQIETYDIFVGKNKPSVSVQFYASAGRTGVIDAKYYAISTTSEVGAPVAYDPTTGVLTVDASFISSGTNTTRNLGTQPAGSALLTDGYFDVVVSDNAQMVGMQMPRCMVVLSTPSGHGATNTKIRNFTVKVSPIAGTTENCFSNVTYNDSTNGSSVTFGEDGNYCIHYAGDFKVAGAASFGISVDSNQLTTGIFSISTSNFLSAVTTTANQESEASWCQFFRTGQVTRPHTAGSVDATQAYTKFSVIKVTN
jgi:hypothetical protein